MQPLTRLRRAAEDGSSPRLRARSTRTDDAALAGQRDGVAGQTRPPRAAATVERARVREVSLRILGLLHAVGAREPSEVELLAARAYAQAIVGLLQKLAARSTTEPAARIGWRVEKQRALARRANAWPALAIMLRGTVALADEAEQLDL